MQITNFELFLLTYLLEYRYLDIMPQLCRVIQERMYSFTASEDYFAILVKQPLFTFQLKHMPLSVGASSECGTCPYIQGDLSHGSLISRILRYIQIEILGLFSKVLRRMITIVLIWCLFPRKLCFYISIINLRMHRLIHLRGVVHTQVIARNGKLTV